MSDERRCAVCDEVVPLHGMVTFTRNRWYHLRCLDEVEGVTP